MTNFAEKRRKQSGIQSLGDLKRSGKVKKNNDPKLLVNSTIEFNSLVNGWKRGEL